MTTRLGKKGIELLKHWEQGPRGGFASVPYKCSANKNTIGWGHVIKVTDNIASPITLAQAEAFLKNDVEWAEKAVNKWVSVPLKQNQFDALVCFVFNIGATAFKNSTLLLYLNQSQLDLVPAQLARWNKSNGKVLTGLTNRRLAELELWNAKV
jgi:lysozyme